MFGGGYFYARRGKRGDGLSRGEAPGTCLNGDAVIALEPPTCDVRTRIRSVMSYILDCSSNSSGRVQAFNQGH